MVISCWNLLLLSKISSELSKPAGQPSVNQISRGVQIGQQSSGPRVPNDTKVNYYSCQRHQHQRVAYVGHFCKPGVDEMDLCDKSSTPTDPSIRPPNESTQLPLDTTCVVSSIFPRHILECNLHHPHTAKYAMQESAASRSENLYPCYETNKISTSNR